MRYVEKNKGVRARFQGKTVVELGSGCGLVGIVLASMGALVTLTDFPDVEYLCDYNIHTNSDCIVQEKDGLNLKERISFKRLVWGEPFDIDPVDFVVGTDVLYMMYLYQI